MLILTRKPNEVIRIGDDVIVTVLGVSGQQVRLGIAAPEGVAVHRQEIYDRIQAEKAQAASVDKDRVNQIAREGENVNQEAEFCIDDHIQMAADAKRYRWLRDRNRTIDIDEDLAVAAGNAVYFGYDLDKNIDDEMRLASLEELQPCEQ